MRFTSGAYLVSGNSAVVPHLLALLEKEGINTIANPDIYLREYSHFGIDEARELRSRASSRAVAGDRRIFIIVCPGMNSEAQNALLKTLEEPLANAVFFFIVPSPDTFLPTLLSRAQRISLEDASLDAQVDAKAFIAASLPRRLLMLKPLLDRDENDTPTDSNASPQTGPGTGRRDIGEIITFLGVLEKIIGPSLPLGSEGLKAIYRARKYINDKGALLKPLLEQVALLLSQRKG